MKHLLIFTALTLPFLALAEEPELKPIFNGKDFSGWTMSLDEKFLIEDGVIRATNDGGKGDNLLTEKTDYKNFVIELEFSVSIDVDSIDLWLLRGLLLAGYRPRPPVSFQGFWDR